MARACTLTRLESTTVASATDRARMTIGVVLDSKPVTSPDGVTVARPMLLDSHVTPRAMPALATTVAVSLIVCPSSTTAVGGVTASCSEPTARIVFVAARTPLPSPIGTVTLITAVPPASARISPVPDTASTAGFDDDHVSVRSASAVPVESVTTAASWRALASTMLSLDASPAIATDATSAASTVTRSVARLLTSPSATISMSATPAVMPLIVADTLSIGVTVATAAADDTNRTLRVSRPVVSTVTRSTADLRSRSVRAVVDSTSDCTAGGRTVNRVTPAIPKSTDDAVIVALPAATAPTSPALVTVATPGSLETYLTAVRPSTHSPPTTAATVDRPPTSRLSSAGVTDTVRGDGAMPPQPPRSPQAENSSAAAEAATIRNCHHVMPMFMPGLPGFIAICQPRPLKAGPVDTCSAIQRSVRFHLPQTAETARDLKSLRTAQPGVIRSPTNRRAFALEMIPVRRS